MQVAISYIVMLVYIALALGYLPADARPWAVLVTGRASLGLGGVAIVLAAVASALGLCSLFGMWSTLIIMEVRPAHLEEPFSIRASLTCITFRSSQQHDAVVDTASALAASPASSMQSLHLVLYASGAGAPAGLFGSCCICDYHNQHMVA